VQIYEIEHLHRTSEAPAPAAAAADAASDATLSICTGRGDTATDTRAVLPIIEAGGKCG